MSEIKQETQNIENEENNEHYNLIEKNTIELSNKINSSFTNFNNKQAELDEWFFNQISQKIENEIQNLTQNNQILFDFYQKRINEQGNLENNRQLAISVYQCLSENKNIWKVDSKNN